MCSYGSVRAEINNACSVQLLVRSFATGSRAAHTQNIWDHIESYVTHTSWPVSRLFFYLPKIKLIISFLDPQPLLLIITMLILVASTRQAPYLACLRVLRLAIRPRSESKNYLKIKSKIMSYDNKTKTVRLLNQRVITREDNIPLKVFHSLHRLMLGC